MKMDNYLPQLIATIPNLSEVINAVLADRKLDDCLKVQYINKIVLELINNYRTFSIPNFNFDMNLMYKFISLMDNSHEYSFVLKFIIGIVGNITYDYFLKLILDF